MKTEELPERIEIPQTVTTETERFVPMRGKPDLFHRVVETSDTEQPFGSLSRANWAADESMAGWTFYHGNGCAIALMFDSPHLARGAEPITVESVEPLTIVEEIDCPRCGIRGHITDGNWVAYVAPEPEAVAEAEPVES